LLLAPFKPAVRIKYKAVYIREKMLLSRRERIKASFVRDKTRNKAICRY